MVLRLLIGNAEDGSLIDTLSSKFFFFCIQVSAEVQNIYETIV